MCVKLFTECKIKPGVWNYTACKTPHFVQNYTIFVNPVKNYIVFVEQHILCNIKGVSFTYPLEFFTLGWIFYTTSGCDGCDKYQVWEGWPWGLDGLTPGHIIYQLAYCLISQPIESAKKVSCGSTNNLRLMVKNMIIWAHLILVTTITPASCVSKFSQV